jgi:hypothetical protein
MAPLGVIFPFFLDSVGLASSVSFALCYGSIFVGIVVGFLNLNELVYRAARETLSFALVKLRMV